MKAQQIRELDTPQILDSIEKKREELWKLKMAWSTNTLENPWQIRAARKDLARLLTIAHERHLAVALIADEGETKNAE